MRSPPDTRYSLILRLKDAADAEAWHEFTAIYRPLIYRLARGKGLQDADAQDVAQEAMAAVSKAVERWTPDAGRGTFRTWLYRIGRNLTINFLTRRQHQPIGSGDSGIAELLLQQCDPASAQSTVFDIEYQREVFHWAADQVRKDVSEQTWRAFWLTSVEEQPIRDVARALKVSEGSIYIARSRVMARLREMVRSHEFPHELSGEAP